jgi:long-subunit fatty acid transport protein
MLFCLLFILNSFADLQSLYGVGSSSTALLGANRNIPYEASSSIYNPAMQNLYEKTQLNVGWIYAVDDFEQPTNVVVENEFIGGSNVNNRGDVDTDVDDTNNIFLSSVFVFERKGKKKSIGVHLSIPTEKIVGVETQSAYYPQYAMYFADTQRITLNGAYAWSPTDTFHVGLGFHFYMTTGSTVKTILPASDAMNPRTSTVDIKLEVKPSVAPVLGMIWNPEPSHFFGFNYIGERDAEMVFDAKNNVNVLSASPIPVNFEGSSSLYYDPEIYSLAYSYQGISWDIHASVDWERWSEFEGSSVIMKFDSDTSFQQFLDSSEYEDILTPKLSFVYKYGKNDYYFGIGYRPTPVPKPTGNLNYLDSDRYMLGLGYGRKLDYVPFLSDEPSQIFLHFQAHSLKEESVTKTGNQIGAPGYNIKGNTYSVGLSWNMQL